VPFNVITAIVAISFVLGLGSFVLRAVKGGMQWNKNNRSPVLTVEAKVVTKRMAVNNSDFEGISSSCATYYVSFEVESGDRMEFRVPDREYGMLCEGDIGRVTFQGTRYKGFERKK